MMKWFEKRRERKRVKLRRKRKSVSVTVRREKCLGKGRGSWDTWKRTKKREEQKVERTHLQVEVLAQETSDKVLVQLLVFVQDSAWHVAGCCCCCFWRRG